MNYSGYETSGEFSVLYKYDSPIPFGSANLHNQNELKAQIKFVTLNDTSKGDTTEMRRRDQTINMKIRDDRMPDETATRQITVEYDEDWNVDTIKFIGTFVDDVGKTRKLSMELDGDFRPQSSPFASGVLTFIDGNYFSRTKNLSEETFKQAQNDIFDFCKHTLEEARAMKDERGDSVMEKQLYQLRDYEQMIEMGRRSVERKHATEAMGYEGKSLDGIKLDK